ncbi:MAG TPA: 23S rRNA (pseudouridine(1915)-N(3))-methyltransferase RlmH [Candidatus Saccharibacteria bacterium]|jgi:23S rRNA (pseudouridine1915-N3)-methyltransferase|nr:23S rRNA (pseudouridine(1915)-N(3))-methyltransferase RlmH [Candidatus Saccharibacteria bacterium]HMT56104.1 23S rRNA (pseudouridine(1915)-N(3))-methyltransferase RlmH [Candidatus Saccharibacteria bacterium]
MTIEIITVGARPKSENAGLAHDFLKRLPKHVQVTWRYLKHAAGNPSVSKHHEAESILRTLGNSKKFVILLDEKGKQLSSPELARLVFAEGHESIVFIIGGAYGITPEIRAKADVVWSLGMLVYPHQLVRVILSEQLYRAHAIHTGHPYHHE